VRRLAILTILLSVAAPAAAQLPKGQKDHSREHVPVFLVGARIRPGVDVGTRPTFADLGQTVAAMFGVAPLAHGTSFCPEILR
jgi:phosphopentomutase